MCVIYIYIQTINLHSFSHIYACLYFLFLTYIWFVYMTALPVGWMGGIVMKVNLDGSVKKRVWLQIFHWNLWLEGLFVFQVPVNSRYIVELDPIYPRMNLFEDIFYQVWYITNPVHDFCFNFIIILPFIYMLDYLVGIFEGWHYLECNYHRTRTWRPWWNAATVTKYNYFQRVGHGHPQFKQLKTSNNPCQ